MINKIKNIFREKYLAAFLILSNIFLMGLYLSKPGTDHIIIEESALGFIPRNKISRKYDADYELESFLRVFIFKRYNFTPENAETQIEESFLLSGKRVEDFIRKNSKEKRVLERITAGKISQIFTPVKPFKYAMRKNAIEAAIKGERIVTRGAKIDSRDTVKLSFLIRLKERNRLNPYRFYVDGIKEEIVK